MKNAYSMTQMAASIANAMGFAQPEHSAPSIPAVDRFVKENLGGRADRVLIYNPDCMGQWFWQKYTQMYLPVEKHVQLAVPVAAVMPSVTPVCFGTMYTGAMPAVHGIRQYEKPVIRIESLFDAAAKAGKKVALVAVEGSSMAVIFAGRPIDYYILPYDEDVNAKTVELLRADRYDLIVAYNQEYDDKIHAHTPEALEAMAAAQHHIEAFDRLARAAEESWDGHNGLIVWASDHGCHVDWDGHGNHGEYSDEDINVLHFYGAVKKA